MSKISVIIKQPGKNPYHTHIENTLKNFQANVGGYIESYTVALDAAIICNEEGAINGMPYNCNILGNHFYGPLIFVGVDGDEFCDFPVKFHEFKRLFHYLWDRHLEVI